MANSDEERWNKLMTSINNLTQSHVDLRSEIQTSNGLVESFSTKLNDFEKRLVSNEKILTALGNNIRSRNVVLFKLEDSIDINKNIFSATMNIFKRVGLEIPEVAIDDIFRLGKSPGNCPVLIKFISARWVKKVFSKVREIRALNFIITNDRPMEEREKRRKLLPLVQQIRESGLDASLKGSEIWFNGAVLTKENLDRLVSSLNPSPAKLLNNNHSNSVNEKLPSSGTPLEDSSKKKRGRPPKTPKSSLNKRPLNLESLDDYFSPPSELSQGTSNPKKICLTTSEKRSSDPQ